ncbi:MAG: hypothetical protein EBT27_11215, partial [Betaproteobacteria bacterium]|nr:hypothetical protein [Betaproteobacteria bacterium]
MAELFTVAVLITVFGFAAALVATLVAASIGMWLDLLDQLAERRKRRKPQPEPSFSDLLMPRDRDPDWRRSFNHENTSKPSGPPPLLFRRGERVYRFQPRGQGARSNPNP